MFSWFLKLLGINEDRPAASSSSLLNSTTAKEQAKPKPATSSETKAEPKAEVKAQPKAKVKVEATKKSTSKTTKASLSDEFPDLKANLIKVLNEAGFNNKAAIKKASDKELLALKGIGQATLKILRK